MEGRQSKINDNLVHSRLTSSKVNEKIDNLNKQDLRKKKMIQNKTPFDYNTHQPVIVNLENFGTSMIENSRLGFKRMD